jgi:hypothetical protein
MSDRPPDLLTVSIENGKYTVIQDAKGFLHAMRHSEPWRDCTGDKLILGLAQTVDELRKVAVGILDILDACHRTESALEEEQLRARLEELKK